MDLNDLIAQSPTVKALINEVGYLRQELNEAKANKAFAPSKVTATALCISTQQAADMLNVSRQTILNYLDKGILKGTYTGVKGGRQVNVETIKEFINHSGPSKQC